MSGFVYFVQATDGSIKIGFTGHVQTRLSGLSTSVPGGCRLLGSVAGGRELERKYHKQFESAHISGEWFRPTPELLALVASLANDDGEVEPIGDESDASPPPPSVDGAQIAEEASRLVRICAYTAVPVDDHVHGRRTIIRAAKRLGMTPNRVKSFWYHEARVISAGEYFTLLRVAASHVPDVRSANYVLELIERRVVSAAAGVRRALEGGQVEPSRKDSWAGTTRADIRRMAERRAAA